MDYALQSVANDVEERKEGGGAERGGWEAQGILVGNRMRGVVRKGRGKTGKVERERKFTGDTYQGWPLMRVKWTGKPAVPKIKRCKERGRNR